MKTRCSLIGFRRAFYLLAGVLVMLSHQASAQQNVPTFFVAHGEGEFGVSQGRAAFGMHSAIGFAVGGNDPGLMLMKGCDTNQDGAVMPDELRAALGTWFQIADTDTDGAVSQNELASALRNIFPMPEPPPGLPVLPDEFGLHSLLAGKLMLAVDINKDGWLTLKEWLTYAEECFPAWDTDHSGWLNRTECSSAFAELLIPDGSSGPMTRGGMAGPGIRSIRVH